jgi:acyl carrier protein
MRDLFDEYTGPISLQTTARDVPQWDSLSHIRLMVLIEESLGVRFGTTEMQDFKNLGDLVEAVVRKSS